MQLFLLFIVSSLGCNELEELLTKDLPARVASYNSQGVGLDSLQSIEQCRITERKNYYFILWTKGRMPIALYGFCVPNTCRKEEIESLMNSIKQSNKTQIHNVSMIFTDIDLQKTAETSIFSMFFLISFIILLVLTCLATSCSIFSNFNNDKTLHSVKEFLVHFDLIENIKKFSTTDKDFKTFGFFDGIRSICAILILLFHCFVFFLAKPLNNRNEFIQYFDSILYAFVNHLSYSVDIFFFIAGFLMSMLTIKEFQDKGNQFSWTKCIARRLVRILPPYLFIIGIDLVLHAESPKSIGNIMIFMSSRASRHNWWKNPLLIHNHFLKYTSPHLVWTWTTAADFQFYLISLIFIFIYCKNESAGIKLIFVTVSVSSAYTAYCVQQYNVHMHLFDSFSDINNKHFIYYPCWTRIPTYLVGVVLGILYRHIEEKSQKTPKTSIVLQLLAYLKFFVHDKGMRTKTCIWFWFINIILALVPYFVRNFEKDSNMLGLSMIWFSSIRLVFIFSFVGLVVPMMFGYYRTCLSILNSRVFKLFSKVSYSFYLVHIIILELSTFGITSLETFNIWSWAFESVQLIVLAFIAASLMNIIVESPFLSIEKKYLSR